MMKMGTFYRFKKVVGARASNAPWVPTLMVFSFSQHRFCPLGLNVDKLSRCNSD